MKQIIGDAKCVVVKVLRLRIGEKICESRGERE